MKNLGPNVSITLQKEIIKSTIAEIELVRKDAEKKLKTALLILGTDNAEDISNYFFGTNPKLEELTTNLFNDLKIFK